MAETGQAQNVVEVRVTHWIVETELVRAVVEPTSDNIGYRYDVNWKGRWDECGECGQRLSPLSTYDGKLWGYCWQKDHGDPAKAALGRARKVVDAAHEFLVVQGATTEFVDVGDGLTTVAVMPKEPEVESPAVKEMRELSERDRADAIESA